MRYLILVLVSAIFIYTSCAKDEKKTDSTTSSDFAPPSWIQASWTYNSDTFGISGYKFTSSDVYMIISGQVIATGMKESGGASVQQLSSTDSQFSFSGPIEGKSGDESWSGTLTYVFTKETTSTIKLTGSSTTKYMSITETTYTKDTSL